MCAERVYFQCHRMLVSDYLTAHGHTVLHIDDDKRPLRDAQADGRGEAGRWKARVRCAAAVLTVPSLRDSMSFSKVTQHSAYGSVLG